ncbi:hypothetical protein EDEG_03634 [Edhazardia aedis USNM 41457]|uniref:Uncharacterized protein n=1 Tax=Edhazardia aedis (strain USNM 41457) TaxID=1003232 RepID=J9D205_EDHAE|nr:hypothetical protein EDEG_03634 [Edhazardia aedis USNM 41457]|eukprot:EJW01891.1 hypothetical protein EDEG_03634 [Edhazardia aedis USNM 41457]
MKVMALDKNKCEIQFLKNRHCILPKVLQNDYKYYIGETLNTIPKKVKFLIKMFEYKTIKTLFFIRFEKFYSYKLTKSRTIISAIAIILIKIKFTSAKIKIEFFIKIKQNCN